MKNNHLCANLVNDIFTERRKRSSRDDLKKILH